MGKYDPQKSSSATWDNYGTMNCANELANLNFFYATKELYKLKKITDKEWGEFLIKYMKDELFEKEGKPKCEKFESGNSKS